MAHTIRVCKTGKNTVNIKVIDPSDGDVFSSTDGTIDMSFEVTIGSEKVKVSIDGDDAKFTFEDDSTSVVMLEPDIGGKCDGNEVEDDDE